MASRVEFRIDCVPPKATHHQKKIVHVHGRARMADSAALNDAKDLLTALLIPHRPSEPVPGPVVLDLLFIWPWRSSEPKKNRALLAIPHQSRPDASNLAKTLEDRLVALRFIADDGLVSDLIVRKRWGEYPGIAVRIETVEESL